MEAISRYIDFHKIWNDLKNDYKDCPEEIEDEKIRKFMFFEGNQIPLDTQECSFENDIVSFDFGIQHGDANESDTQGSFTNIIIGFDMEMEYFMSYEDNSG